MASATPFVKACLNGGRAGGDGSPVPTTPEALAREAQAAVEAGAAAVHMHPRDADGAQTLEREFVEAAVDAVRRIAPGVRVGVTTGAWIERDPQRRLALVTAWQVLPDFASVNYSEKGASDLGLAFVERGVGVEAGIWSPADAEAFVASPLAHRCERVLVEPLDREAPAALATAAAILQALDGAGVAAPRLLHGNRATTWPVLLAALERGYQARIGLEDTESMPDGSPAPGNGALVRVALRLWQRRTGQDRGV